MFDNQTPPNATPPTNLPLGEPDDMFAGASVPEPVIEPVNQETPIISAPIPAAPTALDAGVLRARNPLPTSVPIADEDPSFDPPLTPVPPTNRGGMGQGDGGGTLPSQENILRDPMGGHKTWITIIVLLSLAVVGVAGAWVYVTYFKPIETRIETTNTAPVNTETAKPAETAPTVSEVETEPATSTDSRILFGEPVLDTDSDGLDDEFEKKNGTNMLAWDSDEDTLGDGEEILTWKTNPNKSDTDDDGFADGVEIRNGYNPLGTGKLFAIPTPTTTATTTKS